MIAFFYSSFKDFSPTSQLALTHHFSHLKHVDQEPFPTEFQKKVLWRAVTGIAIVIIGALLVGLIWLSSGIFGYLQPVLVPLAVAGIIAYLLEPVVRFLQSKGLSRIKGIITVFAAFLIFFGGLLAFVGIELSSQLGQATGKEKGSLIESMKPETLQNEKENQAWGWIVKRFFTKDAQAVRMHLENGGTLIALDKQKWRLNPATGILEPLTLVQDSRGLTRQEKSIALLLSSDWKENVKIGENDHAENIIALENFSFTAGGHWLSNLGKNTLFWLSDSSGKILGFFGIIIGFAMVPIYLYYFLKESNSIQSNWHDYVPLKASKFKNEVIETVSEVNGYLISFFRGQVLVAFIDGLLVGLALFFYGLDYGLLIGLLMAILGIIPYLGNIICLVPACIIAYFQSSSAWTNPDATAPWNLPAWGFVFGVVAIFIIVQQINSLLTAPKIVGDSVGLHPMTVIFSMLFWSLLLGGFLGALLAVPLTAAVKVIFRRYLWERKVEPTLPRAQASGT